jgi:hypothetical protein
MTLVLKLVMAAAACGYAPAGLAGKATRPAAPRAKITHRALGLVTGKVYRGTTTGAPGLPVLSRQDSVYLGGAAGVRPRTGRDVRFRWPGNETRRVCPR